MRIRSIFLFFFLNLTQNLTVYMVKCIKYKERMNKTSIKTTFFLFFFKFLQCMLQKEIHKAYINYKNNK